MPEQDRRGNIKNLWIIYWKALFRKPVRTTFTSITSGPIPPNPSELIGSSGMIAILKSLGERFDYVILDTAPVLAVTDTMLLSTMSDAVVVVSSADQMRAKTLKKVVGRLEEMNANVVGIVVNRTPEAKLEYYSYYRDESEVEEKGGPDNRERSNQPVNGKNGLRNRVLQFVTKNGGNSI
jgi:Mrp family chromosome partitioning ATPase